MSKQPNAGQLNKPLQPIVMLPAEGVAYTEFLPDSSLQHLIYYYWEFRTESHLEKGFAYRVVPNGCIDIYFEINNPQQNFVTGLSNRHSELLLSRSFRYIGICFMPSAFTQLYHISASALSNRIENLADVVPGTSRFITDHCSPGLSALAIKSLLDNHFFSLLRHKDVLYDHRVAEAVHIILKSSGSLNVETDLDIGVSPRQLRRLFEFYIGDTPKVFSKIIRFQKVLQNHWAYRGPDRDKLHFDEAYHDQAHFIKEFKSFYGATPGKVFKK